MGSDVSILNVVLRGINGVVGGQHCFFGGGSSADWGQDTLSYGTEGIAIVDVQDVFII